MSKCSPSSGSSMNFRRDVDTLIFDLNWKYSQSNTLCLFLLVLNLNLLSNCCCFFSKLRNKNAFPFKFVIKLNNSSKIHFAISKILIWNLNSFEWLHLFMLRVHFGQKRTYLVAQLAFYRSLEYRWLILSGSKIHALKDNQFNWLPRNGCGI